MGPAVIGLKHGFGLGHLAQLAIESLNGVGGADQPAHLLGELEISAEIGSARPSGSGIFQIFLVPVPYPEPPARPQRHRLPSDRS